MTEFDICLIGSAKDGRGAFISTSARIMNIRRAQDEGGNFKEVFVFSDEGLDTFKVYCGDEAISGRKFNVLARIVKAEGADKSDSEDVDLLIINGKKSSKSLTGDKIIVHNLAVNDEVSRVWDYLHMMCTKPKKVVENNIVEEVDENENIEDDIVEKIDEKIDENIALESEQTDKEDNDYDKILEDYYSNPEGV